MGTSTNTNDITGWERVAMAIEGVRRRLQKTARTLREAGVPYAVIGGNAVAEWVGQVDDGAVRFTRDVDILLRRQDLPAAIDAMKANGFEYHRSFEVDMFLDGPDAKPSEAVHVIFAGEKVRESDIIATPEIDQAEQCGNICVISLQALVRMKLTSFRDKDRTHLRDMIAVGLIDRTWVQRLPKGLADRLAEILDTPEENG